MMNIIVQNISTALFTIAVYDPRAADFLIYAATGNYVLSMMAWLIRGLAGILYVPAILNIIRSITDAQEAKANGSGAAADKAKNELIVGLLLLLLATVIIASAVPLATAFLGT